MYNHLSSLILLVEKTFLSFGGEEGSIELRRENTMKKSFHVLLALFVAASLFVVPTRAYAQTDGTWEFVSLGNPGLITAICSDGTALYAALYEGTNISVVYKSSDGGARWTAVTVFTNQPVNTLLSIGTNLYAGTFQDGVFLSTDRGTSWTDMNNGLEGTAKNVNELYFDGTALYAGTNGTGLSKSIDGGASWTATSLKNEMVQTILSVDDALYVGCWSGVYKSTDSGTSWTLINNGLMSKESKEVQTLHSVGSVLYVGTNAGVFTSPDGGANWTPANNGLPPLEVYSLHSVGTTLYAGVWQGGVYASTDGGANWTAMNSGLSGTNLNVGVLYSEGTTLFAGTVDGLFRCVVSTAPTITTTSLPGGTVGTSYSQTLAATGIAPITWAITAGSLPSGLTLDTSSGAISGTPTAAGTFNFTVEATNAAGTMTRDFSITIAAAGSGSGLANTGDSALPIGMAALALLAGAGVLTTRRRLTNR